MVCFFLTHSGDRKPRLGVLGASAAGLSSSGAGEGEAVIAFPKQEQEEHTVCIAATVHKLQGVHGTCLPTSAVPVDMCFPTFRVNTSHGSAS